MRRDRVGRRTATLMYAGSDRRSAMRRMVPLTSFASALAGWHRAHGDLPCCGGVPAHGGGLAHRPAGEMRSVAERFISRRHLAPEEPGELSCDRGRDDLVRGLPCREAPEFPAEMELGTPGTGDRLGRATLLTLGHDWSDRRAVLIGPGRLDELGTQMGVPALVIRPRLTLSPLEYSLGTRPQKPMRAVAFPERRQSHTSALSMSAPISVTPR